MLWLSEKVSPVSFTCWVGIVATWSSLCVPNSCICKPATTALYRNFETKIPGNETARPSFPVSKFMYLEAIYIFPRSVLLGISTTLEPKKQLTFLIGNCMLIIYVKSRLNRRSRREGKELPPTTVSQQFPALLSAPAVEPRVLSRNTTK